MTDGFSTGDKAGLIAFGWVLAGLATLLNVLAGKRHRELIPLKMRLNPFNFYLRARAQGQSVGDAMYEGWFGFASSVATIVFIVLSIALPIFLVRWALS